MNNTPVNPYSHKDANQDFQQTVIPHPTESSQVLGKFDDRPMEQSDVAKQAIAGLPSSDELLTFDQQTDYEPVEKPIDYQPTKENAKYFSAVVANIGRLKENKEDDSMRKANILEGICAMSPQLKEMSEIDPDATLNVFFGSENAKSIDAMEQVLTNINDSIEEDRENELLFDSMSDKDRRAFIESQYKDRLKTGISIIDTPTGYQQTITDYRKATDDEIKKWSGEYVDTLKYKQFWQARSLCGADNMRLAFALSTIESESGFETFKDDVGKLSDEEKFRVYIVARGLAKKKDYWNSVLSRWGEGWESVGSFIADIATFKNFELNAIKFSQFVDENGGVDAVKNNPELLRKLFRTGDLGEFNTTTEEASGEKLAPLGVRYYAESESDAMSKVEKIYDAGKRQISARKTLREMQLALSDNYKSNGYIEDRIADGVFYALEAGQFALTAIGTGGVGFGLKVASATAKLGKMVSVAEKLATASKVAYKGANYSMYGHKLVMPYFYARMAHDAQQSAIDAGLDDTQAFMYGSAVGLINSYLEKIQFNLTLKNVFLGSKVVDLLANGKSALTQITLQHALQSAKRRATIFGQEYLIETLQNANDELGLFFSAKLADKEYIEFEDVMNRLTQQGKDMIIPLLVSTNIGAGRGNFVSDVAKGVKFKNDPSAFRRYMGAVHFNEAMTHLENSGIPNISEKDAFDFVDAQNDLDKAQADFENAETQEEKDKAQAVIDSAKATQDKILGNLDEKQRRQAEKSLMDFASETAKGVNEIIESVVEKVKSSSDAKALPAPVDHELNKRFIQDYAKWVGIQDDIIYLESLNDADEDVIETMKSKLRNEGKSENEINDILFGEKGIDGARFNGKIYIVGSKTKSTSRTLEVLKHETGHKGAEKIRETAEFKTFLDKLLDSAGGEAIVREALSRAKGGAYDTYERYDLAEEFMCTLAEKVKGGNELTKEELSTWAKIVNFFVELLADIPENPKFRDRHIANLIRAIWKEEYLEDTPEAFDFEAESDLESSHNIVEKEASETQKKKAKQNFRMKILRMRLREKSLTDSEREELEEKIRIQEWLDTIPDENVAEKLEAISSVEDEDLLSDEILLYAVENGATWADEALTRRHNEQEEKEVKKGTQSLLPIMESNNIKLPTPKAIRDYCKANGFSLSSTLHGEINDIYSGLKLDIKQKYFSKHYREIDSAFIDELNTELGFDYKDVSEFLQDFADNVWGVSESRFSFVDNGGEAKRQYDEVVAKYKGTPQWLKAPNGQPTKLTERQWVMVRTQNFKKWFGDWETLAIINEVESMPAISVEVHEALDKAGIKEVFKSFGEVQNKKDGRSVIFPSKSAGKIYYHKGFDTSSIIRNFKPLFENSTHIISEKEEVKKGHKIHPNVLTYEHYVNKFVVNKEEYYIRFTVPVIKNDKTANIVHSSAISEVSIYKNGDSTMTLQKTAGNSSPSFIDDKLSKFLSSVNKKDVSKVVDENGEPLVVYHGTNWEFNSFKYGVNNNSGDRGYLGRAFYATNDLGIAETYADDDDGRVMELFLNIRNPYMSKDSRHISEPDSFANDIGVDTYAVSRYLKNKGFDGVISETEEYARNDSDVFYKEYAVYNSNQIKSATDNLGTFDSANDDIRFSFVGKKANADFIPVGYKKSLSSLLEEAINLFRDDIDIATIYSKTGWYLDDENPENPQWKFEVQNPLYDFVELGVDEKLDKNEPLFLNDIFPEDAPIFKVYPHLKNIRVVKDSNEGEASFSAETNTINLASFVWDGLYNVNKIFGGKGKLSKKQQDEAYGIQTRQNFLLQFTLEHEIQHAIQSYEGFDAGGNPASYKKILQCYLGFKSLIRKNQNLSHAINVVARRVIEEVESLFGITESDLLDGDVNTNIDEYALALYYNTKGEIEAYTTKYRLQKTEEERNEEAFFETQKKVKESLKEAVKRNVNTIFRSNYSKLKSLTDDCAFVLSRLFEEYSYLKDEKIRNNIPDFIKRITSSNATCSTGEVDSGYVRQEIRGDLQKGIRFSYKETRTQEELDALNKQFQDLYEQYKNGDQDAYKRAVELVKAEAERKGYNRKGYHTTYADFTEFDKKRQRKGQMGKGFYFSDRADYSYGNKKIDVYLDDSHDFKRSEKYGYSLVKNPEQIKLQDPFTFDDNGELIPLTERFNENNPDMRFSIIGEKGAGNLQDGVALEKLKEAINLENKNTNPTDIWRSTGWERSPIDDKWRFEIPYGNLKKSGTASKFPYNTKKEYTLAEVWDAPVLYDAYPELKNIKVKFYKDAHSNVGGSTLHSQKLIKVNLSLHRENIFGEWYCSDVKLKNTFIHEIQHFIQHIEGFAKGGSVYSIRRTLAELRNPNEFPVLQKAYEEAYQKYLDFLKQFNWDGVGDMPDDVAIEINSNPQLEREYKRLVSNVNSSYSVGESFVRSNIKDDPYNVYNRLGGEVEARNASERSTMTEEERRYKNPSLTADVDIGSQIFLFKDESGAEPIIRFRDYESGENYNVGNELFGTGDMRFSVADTKPERLKKLRESKPIVINSKNIKIRIGADLKTRKKDAYKIGMSLRGTYYNKDTGDKIEVVEKSISEFLRHDVDFESKEDIVNVSFAHLLSVSKIPEIIENSIYINSVPNEDPKNYGKIDTFDYYFVGLKIDRKDYTAKVVVAKNSNGQKYYDHALSKIEKGKLLWHLIKSLRRGSDTSRNLPYGIRDKRIFSLLQENNQPDADFSYTDNDILQKKRELSVDLAKKIYNRISKDIDFDLQNKEHRKLLRPTEDDRDFVFNADLSMLDDDVDFVLDRAEAILWKLINGSPKKSLQNDFDRYAVSAERDIENSRIFDAVIKDALNEFKKESKLQAKLKAQIQKDAEKQANAVVGYNLDELAVNGVDLLDTIANANEDDITNAIDQIFAFCDDWANSEGLSFDMAFAKKRATLVSCFDDIANQLTYGRHFKSAVRAIEKLRSIENESVLKNQSIRLAKRFAEYLIEQTQELEKIKLETQELEEKAKQKKEKEKLEREAKLLEKKRQRAIKLFKNFALGQKLPVANKLDIKRPLPAKVQAYLAQIKKVIGKSADKVAERYQFLQQKALDRNSENKPIDFRERYEMSALMIYGNIAEKSLAEILFAYDELKQLIAGEKDKQFERQEKLEAQVAETAEPLVKALKLAGYNKGKSGGGFSFVSREISMFEHGLRNIFLTKKGMSDELRKQVENWVVETARQVGRSALGERRFHEDEMIWLKNILAKCYGDAEKGFARLTHIDDKLAKFSSVAGRQMSIGQIMQIVCTLEQWQVKEAIKQAEKKYLNKDADLSEEYLRRYHYWKFLKENDANMRSFLSESDLSFIQALKMRYADRYNKINPLYEELNGVPMIANGSNYIPIVREGDYTLGETKRVVAVFPAYYTPRTISLKEIDEDANIVHIFINRTREDAHFLNFAKLTFMSQELTANYDFNQAIKLNMSDNERAWFNDMMTDVLTGKIAHSDSANKKLVSFFSKVSAYAGLMYNLTSAVKQVSALPAFLLQVDSKEFVNGLKLAIENGEFWTAMREFLGSDYMQDRYRSGEVNQILAEITKAEKDNNVGDSGWKRFRRMFVKFGFMPISAMDWLSHALCGTMLYYSTYKKYAELYPEDEAKRLAIMDTCSVGEMTQQSAMIHNLGETQRSGESMMKMFTQFRTANRQYMSYEINALGEFVSNPSWARFRRAGKTVVLNHLVLPALFNGIGLFMDALLGDDIDDDDWEYFWKSTALKCFLDVFTGWYISAFFGEAIKIAFLNQYGKSADTMMSSTAFFRIVDTCVFAIRDLTKNGLDDFDLWEHLDKLGRASFAPYRVASKVYKNAKDDKEGLIW